MVQPTHIRSVQELDDLLSEPFPEDVHWAGELSGDVLVLGAGGKMGPTLVTRIVRAIRRAGSSQGVYAVSRFSQPQVRQQLESAGAHTISADLLDPGSWADLPRCESVIYMIGSKFGTQGRPWQTWAVNAYLPGRVLEHFRDSRIVVLSTGNVYPLVNVQSGGCDESRSPEPVGEYAQSCLGRERVVEYFSRANSTPVCLLRLNYAVENRYGVLLDIARRVWSGEPVALDMGYVNVIWQADANSACFRSLQLCQSPPLILNLTGPETLSVRELAVQFGTLLKREPRFSGTESSTALLSDARQAQRLLGPPPTTLPEMLDRVSSWVRQGGVTLQKPTHFQVRDGRF